MNKNKKIIAAVLTVLALIAITVTVIHFTSAENKTPEAETSGEQIEFSVKFEGGEGDWQ